MQFSPTSHIKYCFCPRVISRLEEAFWRGKTRKAYIFEQKMESLGTNLSSPRSGLLLLENIFIGRKIQDAKQFIETWRQSNTAEVK